MRGRVQGVGFRWFVVTTASELGLTGWVANRSDGTVQLVAEGPWQALRTLVTALHEGPPGADVTDVEVSDRPLTLGLSRFEVRSGYHPGD